jgi:hypothetical protein
MAHSGAIHHQQTPIENPKWGSIIQPKVGEPASLPWVSMTVRINSERVASGRR